MTTLNPIAFLQGDEMAAIVSDKVYEELFSHLPIVKVDVSVENRAATKDAVIADAVAATKKCNAAVKISTASARSKAHGQKSANIVLRPALGAVGALRITQADGVYKAPVGVFRFLSGDFYSERNYHTETIDGRQMAICEHVMDIQALPEFAQIGLNASAETGLRLILCSKYTIAEMERVFFDEISKVWDKAGKEFEKGLSDDVTAQLPHMSEGGFLVVAGNASGDTITDVLNEWHGGHSMGSTVYCRDGLVYEEMPGGTDPRQFEMHNDGKKTYHTPSIYVNAFADMYARANPSIKDWCENIKTVAKNLHEDTPENERETFAMIDKIKAEIA